jgi:hypothetical protein
MDNCCAGIDVFHPRFHDIPGTEYYREMKYVHWAANDKPRYPAIKTTLRC